MSENENEIPETTDINTQLEETIQAALRRFQRTLTQRLKKLQINNTNNPED